MSDQLGALLDGRVPAAVYRWPRATLPDNAGAVTAASGWRTFNLDGAGVDDREAFLEACADALELPDWFGHNWDALWDCLTDLSWAPAPGYLLIYGCWRELAIGDPDSWANARSVFVEVSRYWAARQTPFAVLLIGDGPDDGLPLLPLTHA